MAECKMGLASHVAPIAVPSPKRRLSSIFGVENRVLFASVFFTLAFSYTQIPLFYAIRHMQCHTFYDVRPPFSGSGDRCGIVEVTAGTASQFSIFNMSTTLCGIFNLFIARWQVERFGPRAALAFQVLVPALRVASQMPAIFIGREAGIAILQASQLITVLGGPAGFVFVMNIIAGGVVEPARRTAMFGKVQGCIMLGEGIGFLGGMAGDAFDIRAPFLIAFASFILAGIYTMTAIPYLAPEPTLSPGMPDQGGLSAFVAPLKIVLPQRLRLVDGRLRKHYGVMFLCSGVFLGVLATAYAPSLMQMYAAASFDFDQAENGWLTSEFALMRGMVLIFIFPRIIAWGRSWFSSAMSNRGTADAPDEASEALAEELGTVETMDQERHGRIFDLVFLRWSLVVDAALTTMAAFSTRRWHVYLAGLVLPFGSGSAPLAKGIISDMCGETRQADALHAITLVEQVAKLVAQGVFGFVFASLAEERKAYSTFFYVAAVAFTGMAVLLLSNFPPANSDLMEDAASDEDCDYMDSKLEVWGAKLAAFSDEDV